MVENNNSALTPRDETSDEQLGAIARDRADWLVDAVATATQDRRFLRGDPACDEVACDAILLNAEKAIRVAYQKASGGETRGDAHTAAPSNWREIETAPRDGTLILWAAANGPRWTYSLIFWPIYDACFEEGFWQPLPSPPVAEDARLQIERHEVTSPSPPSPDRNR
jgi:hypothetical protein